MKIKIQLSVINTLTILIIALFSSLHAASGKKGYTDKDLIDYAASEPAFKASLLLEYPSSSCTINSVKIKDNDPYDFYLTAAHCADLDGIWNKKLIKEELEAAENLLSEVKQALLSKGIINAKSTTEEIKEAWKKYRNHSLNQTDIMSIKAKNELKCVLPYQSTHNTFQDIALCTRYEKSSNRPKYEVFSTQHFDVLDDIVLTQVGFGIRETGDAVLDRVAARQAFKTVIEYQHASFTHGILWAIPFDGIDNMIGPLGATKPGDSGGALLYEKEDGNFYLVAVHSKGVSEDRHAGIWIPTYQDFIEKAYEELISKNKDEL